MPFFRSVTGLLATVLAISMLPMAARAASPKDTPDMELKTEALAFLAEYDARLAELQVPAALAEWKAANSGKAEDYEEAARRSLAIRQYHSNPETYARVKRFVTIADRLPPIQARSLAVAELEFRGNQLPADLLKQMVDLSTEIEKLQKTYRARFDGKEWSNNDLLEMLADENDSSRREALWRALQQVGAVVAPRLVELARLRNRAAATLGFENYWQMEIRLQEHDPEQLLAVFEELETLTREPFRQMKAAMDGELAARFKTGADQLRPWHYDNPFFQAAPPSKAVDLDVFYDRKAKEDITEIARRFYADIGLPIDTVLARSDLYERPGKDQHAFCIHIDGEGDVRTLCNIKPTEQWMDTVLHEAGHAVYDLGLDRSLPRNLREPAHIFTTEGVAMLFGALAKTPSWMIAYGGGDAETVDRLATAIREQRRREQLIFTRWTLVMLHMEKSLYENPERDLASLWWDYKERFQMLRRPEGLLNPDWAAKPHFTIAPVYYHNYQLGELFAAQLRHVLAGVAGHTGTGGELSFNGRKDFGEYLTRKVFRPGRTLPWPRFVEEATGEPLTARYFADEVQ
ncbi:MAG: M2 family metallopeptidase [Thermoguttaceae bacterium]